MALGPSRREEVSEPGTLRRPRFDGRSLARFDMRFDEARLDAAAACNPKQKTNAFS